MKNNYDVLIIGGSPAGLSAALAVGRMGRTALLCDDGRPRNAPQINLIIFRLRMGSILQTGKEKETYCPHDKNIHYAIMIY